MTSAVQKRGCAWMTTAASQRWRQRLFGKGLEMVGFVARQHQLQGQTERRVDRQQFAVAAQFQRGQPGRLTRARLTMMPLGVMPLPKVMGGRLVFGVVMVLHARLGGLDGGEQRAGMNHQHGEQAKPDAYCR